MPAGPSGGIVGRPVTVDPANLEDGRVLLNPRMDQQMLADKYRMLRTQVLMRMRASGLRRLAVTSPGAKAGKTLTSINLAISMARDGNQRVVLIDADLRKPSVALMLGLDASAGGLIDYLTEGRSVEAFAFTLEDIPNLTIIPGRRAEQSQARPELFSSGGMRALLDSIDSGRDPTIVIVDLPPVFVGDDVILVAEHTDSVLLVVEEGSTDIDELKNAAQLLEDFNLIGTVLNKSMERRREDVNGYYHATPPNASQD